MIKPPLKLVVFTHVYPNSAQPYYGLFVRERMRRVAEEIPLVVVAPVPWFPCQSLLRRWKPHFRPPVPRYEQQGNIEIYHPRFFSIPGFFKWTDGWFEALGSWRTMKKLHKTFGFQHIDAHFIYPDGVAARLLARWLNLPYTITLRGSLTRFWHSTTHSRQIMRAMRDAAKVLSVADALRQDAITAGIPADHVQVVGNGVDLNRFFPESQLSCRQRLGLPPQAKVMISVGGLTERKGFHRIIACMPALRRKYPELHFVIAGGSNPEGNNHAQLVEQIATAGLTDCVHLIGAIAPDELRFIYSAGDIFVLATRFEGWANVLLEASACGLPIVTTNVGGNAEVVQPHTGLLVPFGDAAALQQAIEEAFETHWDRDAILSHARLNSWQTRIPILTTLFEEIYAQHHASQPQTPAGD